MRRILPPRLHPDERESFAYTPADFLGRNTEILRAKGNVVLDSCRNELIVRILKYHTDIPANIDAQIWIARISSPNITRPLRREKQRVQMTRKR